MIVIHELGHYSVGRKFGFKIEKFFIGFGPKVYAKVKNGIEYSLRAFPIGGAVLFYGEDEGVKDTLSFNSQKAWKRFLVILAGPIMNLILGIILAVMTLSIYGDFTPVISTIEAGTPAAQADLKVGDEIIAIDNQNIDFYTEALTTLQSHSNEAITLTVKRNDEYINTTVNYYYDKEVEKDRIGVVIGQKRRTFSLSESILLSFKWIFYLVSQMLGVLWGLITGVVSTSSVVGPVGTISYIGEAVRTGFESILRLGCLITVNLGVFNILPLPALDGGRLVFIGLEWLRGKPISREKEGAVHFIGFVLLMLLMVVFTYKDIVRIFS